MSTFASRNSIPARRNATQSAVLYKNRPGPAELVHNGINSSCHPLDSSTRTTMESKFGRSFTSVRLHDNEIANDSAKMMGAEAYTLGNDIVFNRRMRGFDTKDESELLTHELVHVIQSGQQSPPKTRFDPIRISKPGDEAEREADRLSCSLPGTQMIRPAQMQGQATIMRRMLPTWSNFYDPNFCFRPGEPRDSDHPNLNHVVAIMQAVIETPDSCSGDLTLRTSVLQSYWGSVSANFESIGGGVSQGIYERINRDNDAERVDYEERFRLDNCRAQFTRCHLITFSENNNKYVFAKARYQPNIFQTASSDGSMSRAVFNDSTPSPTLEVRPCAGVSTTC